MFQGLLYSHEPLAEAHVKAVIVSLSLSLSLSVSPCIYVYRYMYIYVDETLISLDQQAGGKIKNVPWGA